MMDSGKDEPTDCMHEYVVCVCVSARAREIEREIITKMGSLITKMGFLSCLVVNQKMRNVRKLSLQNKSSLC